MTTPVVYLRLFRYTREPLKSKELFCDTAMMGFHFLTQKPAFSKMLKKLLRFLAISV